MVPLPLMRADPRVDEHALFPKGAVVMALYPQTTCFYRAVVNRLPASAADPYEVLFEVSPKVLSNFGDLCILITTVEKCFSLVVCSFCFIKISSVNYYTPERNVNY